MALTPYQNTLAVLGRIEKKLERDGFNKPYHKELIYYASLPKALRPSRQEICAKLGISDTMYYRLLRDEKFNKVRMAMIKQYYFDDLADVLLAVKTRKHCRQYDSSQIILEFVADFAKDQKRQDPFEAPEPIPPQEINIIIQNLEQKFYGSENKKKINQRSKEVWRNRAFCYNITRYEGSSI